MDVDVDGEVGVEVVFIFMILHVMRLYYITKHCVKAVTFVTSDRCKG